jgi:glycosyltransferase involved in cell wall biosynthesis
LKRRIILLGTTWPFRGGGIATFNERLARALIEIGHEVTIYTFTLQYPSFLFPGKTQYSDEQAPEGLDIHIKVNSINPFNWIKIGNEIKKLRPDLLILRYWTPFMSPSLGTIARIAKRNNHTRVIAVADNIIPHEKHPGDTLLTRYFVKSVEGFITLSRSVQNDLKKFRPKAPTIFTPHPLYDNFGKIIPRDQAIEKLGLDPNFRYLLFFGFIRDYKGLDWLLTAFGDERIRQYPVKLIVAGEFYTSSQKYMQIIKEKKIEDHVVMRTDFIADNEVAYYFGAADMVVQPYKTATQSGVTQIAYHFCTPMLVTNVGGLSEIVIDGKVGYAVKPEPEEISNAIVDFFENNRAEMFKSNIVQEKEKYSWLRMTEAIEEVFGSIDK